ncbi:hypothetical protein NSQ90_15125 [Paenibacillus sp. FSL H7-0737]|nr:hypothetical protein [Paenibacillus sp. FSL H7-0737]
MINGVTGAVIVVIPVGVNPPG